jgi:hypothetical protein
MDDGSIVIMLAALLTVGMMVFVGSLVGIGPSDIACWLELACRQ